MPGGGGDGGGLEGYRVVYKEVPPKRGAISYLRYAKELPLLSKIV